MYIDFASWVHDLESRMQTITVDAYKTALAKLWWQRVAAQKSSVSKKEVFTWLISTAMLRKMEIGTAHFEDMLSAYMEIENDFVSDGLKLSRPQLEDVVNGVPGGEGLNVASRWSRDIGVQAAYWPQKSVAHAILDGAAATSLAYDGLTFFNTGHYVNGVDSSDGTFSNILNPTTVGHATRIDAAVTIDAAIENLAACRSHLAAIKMPNGKDPRNLQIKAILHPPAIRSRVVQICYGSLVAQDATSGGGGSADVAPVVKDWMLEKPLEAPELGASFQSVAGNAGSDTSYYILAGEGPADDELGALVYQERQPFGVIYNDGMTDAELARTQELQWLSQGRNAVGYGHPYLLFRADVS